MSDSDVKAELKRQIVIAKADLAEKRGAMLNDMDQIYADPVKAAKAISEFVKDTKSDKALIEKLETYPAYFGTTKGMPGSGNFLTLDGAKDRAAAKEYVQGLPERAKALQAAENKLYDLQRAFHDDTPSISSVLSRGKGGRGGPDI